MADYSSLDTLPLVPGRVFYAPQVIIKVKMLHKYYSRTKMVHNYYLKTNMLHKYNLNANLSLFSRCSWPREEKIETWSSWEFSSSPVTRPLTWSLRYRPVFTQSGKFLLKQSSSLPTSLLYLQASPPNRKLFAKMHVSNPNRLHTKSLTSRKMRMQSLG